MGQVYRVRQDSILCSSDHQRVDVGQRKQEGQNQEFQGIRETVILSPDPLVRSFLEGILKFQGFQCKALSGFQGISYQEFFGVSPVVFIDSLYFKREKVDLLGLRLEKFAQSSVSFLILAEQGSDIDFSKIFNNRAYQILWKPLDYRKIYQAMTQVWACSNDTQTSNQRNLFSCE